MNKDQEVESEFSPTALNPVVGIEIGGVEMNINESTQALAEE